MARIKLDVIEDATKKTMSLVTISGFYMSSRCPLLQEIFLFSCGLSASCLLTISLHYFWGRIEKIGVVAYYLILFADICVSSSSGYFLKNDVHIMLHGTFWTYDYKSEIMTKKLKEVEVARESTLKKLYKFLAIGICYMMMDVTLLAVVESLINQDILLLFPCWLPFEIDSLIVHIAVATWEIMLVLMVAFVMFGALGMFYIFYSHITTELYLLKYAMVNLHERAAEMAENGDEKVVVLSRCYTRCLAMCAQHHSHIIRYFREVSTITKVCYFASFGTGVVIFTFAGFFVISDNYAVKIKFIGISLAQLFFLYVISWIAETIAEQSSSVGDTAYATDWYNLPKDCHKILLVMRTLSNHPLESTLLTGQKVDLMGFMSIVKVSYSYINMLLATTR